MVYRLNCSCSTIVVVVAGCCRIYLRSTIVLQYYRPAVVMVRARTCNHASRRLLTDRRMGWVQLSIPPVNSHIVSFRTKIVDSFRFSWYQIYAIPRRYFFQTQQIFDFSWSSVNSHHLVHLVGVSSHNSFRLVLVHTRISAIQRPYSHCKGTRSDMFSVTLMLSILFHWRESWLETEQNNRKQRTVENMSYRQTKMTHNRQIAFMIV